MGKYFIIVDMQVDFTTGALANADATKLIPKIADKARELKEQGYKIIATSDTHSEDYLDTQEGHNLPVVHCVRKSEGWMLDKKIQAALDACFLAGGGRVVIPCGVFVTGGIRLRSNTELYLERGAILKGSRDPEAYFAYREDKIEPVTLEEAGTDPKHGRSSIATSAWSNGLIRAMDAENIAVVGEKGSYFDGCNCFDPEGEQNYRGPHGMSIWRCRNIRLEGYTFINSGNGCHAIFKSKNITVRNIEVYGGHDGVDVPFWLDCQLS